MDRLALLQPLWAGLIVNIGLDVPGALQKLFISVCCAEAAPPVGFSVLTYVVFAHGGQSEEEQLSVQTPVNTNKRLVSTNTCTAAD